MGNDKDNIHEDKWVPMIARGGAPSKSRATGIHCSNMHISSHASSQRLL